MGISFFASLSNDEQIENPRHFLKYQSKLRIENRALARKKRLSKSWRKQKDRVSKLHEKIRNVRNDFLQKQSSLIINKFGFICVEDLNVKNMVKFGHLSKHIADCGWSSFFNILGYKSEWNGNEFIRVNPKYTSQTCSHCGATDKLSRQSQSKFVCTSCGSESNADINASKNILSRGTALYREREALACALVEEPQRIYA